MSLAIPGCGELLKLISGLSYDVDARERPDNLRRGRFKAGWADSTVRGLVYSEKSLMRLTWTNLGYRLGTRFGDKDPDEIDRVYECVAREYEKTR